MKRASYHMTDDQAEWLRAESRRTGLKVAELIRRAIDEMREREERKARKKEK